ncbi:MAG: IS481 family transposase [bacterium]|nr:IS481 family transposase [bacterium]MDE0600411.1 IS481 family transposase [bacterium]
MGTNCRKLTPFGLRLLVDRILVEGWPVAHAAEAVGVSRQTAYRWLRRWREEGEAGLLDRSSRPHRSPNRVRSEVEERIVADRVAEKEGPHLMAWRLGVPRSTIYRVLCRRGLSRLSDLGRTTGVSIRYERDCPGELVHVDIKKLGRIPDGGGWRVLGREASEPRQNVGYEYLHSMVDDHSRVAYTEVLDSQDAQACAGFMLRAARWFATWGYRIDRVMTDNAMAYRNSRAFADALTQIGAAHKLIRPYRPQTNGKVERFHQTLLQGWAYKRPYTTNHHRRKALTKYLRTYNHHRPHSSLGGQPPITRLVTHLCGKDI